MNAPLLLLVSLQNLEELLVRLRIIVVAGLDLAEVVDRVVELSILRLVRLARVQASEECGVISALERGRLRVWRVHDLHLVRDVGRRMGVHWGGCNGARSNASSNRHDGATETEWKLRVMGRRGHTGSDHMLARETLGYSVHRSALGRLSHGCCYSNSVRVLAVELYAVAGREEGVESLDEDGVPVEEH